MKTCAVQSKVLNAYEECPYFAPGGFKCHLIVSVDPRELSVSNHDPVYVCLFISPAKRTYRSASSALIQREPSNVVETQPLKTHSNPENSLSMNANHPSQPASGNLELCRR